MVPRGDWEGPLREANLATIKLLVLVFPIAVLLAHAWVAGQSYRVELRDGLHGAWRDLRVADGRRLDGIVAEALAAAEGGELLRVAVALSRLDHNRCGDLCPAVAALVAEALGRLCCAPVDVTLHGGPAAAVGTPMITVVVAVTLDDAAVLDDPMLA